MIASAVKSGAKVLIGGKEKQLYPYPGRFF
jgi:hypothetical protein